jgi:GAF domain-containing protein
MTDLHFLRDSFEGVDFVLALVQEKLPSEVVLLSFFDADKRELVVVRQAGGKNDALLTRTPERSSLAQAAIRGQKAVVVTDAAHDPRAVDPRWKALGVDAKSIIVAPALSGGKTFGMIEILNPEGGGRYGAVDGNALTFIGQQLGEFLFTQGVVLDAEQIVATAKKKGR